MRRWMSTTLLVAFLVALGAAPAVAAQGDLLLSGGPHRAERADDGTTTLTVAAINAGAEEAELRLLSASDACEDTVGEPRLAGRTSATVTFTTVCDAGGHPRSATVQLRPVDGGATSAAARLPLRFTVVPTSPSDWQALWWFLAGVPLALLFVLGPYAYWVAHPLGNAPDPRSSWSWRRAWALGALRLPGITTEWSLQGNWSSNVTVAAGVFTALLTASEPATALLGEDATRPLAVVTVAAALSVALVGTGPLWLVICKRRYPEDPAARHHTVAGVLVASFVVLCASLGLVVTVSVMVDRPAVHVLALAATALLCAYSAKSIPMTLALGSGEVSAAPLEPTAWSRPGARPAVSGMP